MNNKFSSLKKIIDLLRLATFKSKFTVFYLYCRFFIARKIGKRQVLHTGKVVYFSKYNSKIPFCVREQLDLEVLWDSLCKDLYVIESLDTTQVKTVFDLGSNVGATLVNFYYKFPNADIYAVEPDPNNFKRLEELLSLLPNKERVILLNKAVSGDCSREVSFFVSVKNHWSSSMVRKDATDQEIKVSSISLDEMFRLYGLNRVDFMKLDIEGAEYTSIANFNNLSKCPNIIGELHPKTMGVSTEDFFVLLKDFEIIEFSEKTMAFKAVMI